MKPTIRDVAQAAGVSPATVSRFLNKKVALSAELTLRVKEAVKTLDYRPDVIARRLTRGRSETFGIVLPDIATPFFAAVASAAEDEADRRGYTLMICNTRNQLSRELEYLDRLVDRMADGLLFLTNHRDNGALRDKIQSSGNIVLIDEDVPGTSVPKLFVDNYQGGYLAGEHLYDAGHRCIAHLTGQKGLLSVAERLAGFSDALSGHGIALEPGLTRFGAYEAQSGYQAFKEIWARPVKPTAVFAASDMLAIGVFKAARELGLRVPEDISLVGFDDLTFAEFLQPALTTIRQPAEKLGREGIRLLYSPPPQGAVSPRLPVELVVRESVARI